MARPKAFDEDTALLRAMELFRERGYAAAPLAQLAACMGINRQSLYDTYGDKRGLFLRALDHYGGLIGGRLLASLAKYLVSLANGMAVAAKSGATRRNLRDIAGVALTALQPAPIHPRARRCP